MPEGLPPPFSPMTANHLRRDPALAQRQTHPECSRDWLHPRKRRSSRPQPIMRRKATDGTWQSMVCSGLIGLLAALIVVAIAARLLRPTLRPYLVARSASPAEKAFK